MTDNCFHNKYIKDGLELTTVAPSEENTVSWKSPANIALIKYWGKYGQQLPKNPSISFTLFACSTRMDVSYQAIQDNNALDLECYFDNQREINFERKLVAYVERILPYLPFLKRLQLKVFSHNTFPHSAGVASSASSMSALALCVCSIEQKCFQSLNNKNDFLQKASFLARIGSGSASRSVYGSTAIWGYAPYIQGSSNEVAIPVNELVDPVFRSYRVAILVIDSTPKEISSSRGHELMNTHDYAEARYIQANHNLKNLLSALSSGDEILFSEIVEREALSLHGLLLSSRPGYILLHPNTLVVIKRIKEFRAQTSLHFSFTLDAGPNIHLLYHESIRKQMVAFIESELVPFCEHGLWIDDKVSKGPEEITT